MRMENALPLFSRGLHFSPVIQRRIPSTSALWRQIEHIPNWTHLIDSALSNIFCEPWMTGIKMSQRSILVSREHRNRRVLMPFRIFAAEIVFKATVAGAQQTQFVPTATP